uniref:Homeobox protein HAT3.1 n=1 Tax=Rhizophora mucronata TaxID=61149 RepID=A0A2P2JAT3_RHIMU
MFHHIVFCSLIFQHVFSPKQVPSHLAQDPALFYARAHYLEIPFLQI